MTSSKRIQIFLDTALATRSHTYIIHYLVLSLSDGTVHTQTHKHTISIALYKYMHWHTNIGAWTTRFERNETERNDESVYGFGLTI